MGFYLLHCWPVCGRVCVVWCVLTCVALIAVVITLIAVVVLMRQRDLSAMEFMSATRRLNYTNKKCEHKHK